MARHWTELTKNKELAERIQQMTIQSFIQTMGSIGYTSPQVSDNTSKAIQTEWLVGTDMVKRLRGVPRSIVGCAVFLKLTRCLK